MTPVVVNAIQIGDVVPHSNSMLLVERLVACDDDSLTAELTVREKGPFIRDDRVGAWVGVEYMAQAVAAFAGCRARTRGEAPKVGFLVGTRQFTTNVASFPVGAILLVRVVLMWEDESGIGSFTGTIEGDGIAVDATLTVYQPPDIHEFMRERCA